MTEFLARVGDRINPIVVKETRQAVNSRLVAGFLLLFLGIQLVVMLLVITSREISNSSELDLRAGRELFTIVQGILLGTCIILIPTMTGVRLAAERTDVNVDLLFISSLTPRAVLAGKLLAAAALALLIFSACAPFMTFAYVMRGLDVPTILVVLAADYLTVLASTTIALFLASVPANRLFRIVIGIGGGIVVLYLGAGLLVLSSEFLRGSMRVDPSEWQFWAGFAGAVGLTLGQVGLVFVWSVALISPPAANRAFAVRAYTLGLWLAEGVGFGAWSLHLGHPGPMYVWGMKWAVLFSLQMIVAVCERDTWGARVTRRIPRAALLRPLAFLFYSGAAGGLLFGVLGSALTVLGLAAWIAVVPPPGSRYESEYQPAVVAGLIAGYTYCYCLCAAVFRRLFVGTAFRPEYTWTVGLILFGLGCTLPFLVRFALFDRPQYRYSNDLIALYVTNPVVMIDDAMRSSNTTTALTVAFVAVWAGVMTLVNGPWLLKQVARFRPPEPEPVLEVVEGE